METQGANMKRIVGLPAKLMPLRKLVYGKKIAVVGNAVPKEDFSKEIDSADLVFRINHFYSIDSGKLGKRTDVIVQTPTTCWISLTPEERHEDYIRANKPKVLSIKFHDRMQWDKVQQVYAGCEILQNEAVPESLCRLTTGTMFLALLNDYCENCEVKIYGFSYDSDFRKYLETDGKHYLAGGDTENAIKARLAELLAQKRITKPIKQDFRVIIPARKGSSLKGKNVRIYKGERLLDSCIRKCVKIFGEGKVICLTDSEQYAEYAREAGAIVPYIDWEVDDLEDISVRLQRWRDREDFCGNIIGVQCTSPNVSEETLLKFKELAETKLDRGETWITVAPLEYKSTALFLEDRVNETGVQLLNDAPTKPRQIIPTAFRFTGAVFLFPSIQLRNNPSLFDRCKFHFVKTTEAEGLDIDRLEDFEK